MTALPAELLTLLTSSTLASTFKLCNMHLKAKRDERLATLIALRPNHSFQDKAPKKDRASLQWTRRIIALTAVFFIIAFPKLVAFYRPDIAVHIGYPQASPGFLFFTSDFSTIHWAHLRGLVVTPLDTHLVSAIIGLYFGSSIINAS